jgi:hypothetical protein
MKLFCTLSQAWLVQPLVPVGQLLAALMCGSVSEQQSPDPLPQPLVMDGQLFPLLSPSKV